MLRYQEDQAADTERLQPTISTEPYSATIGNLILLVLVLAPHPSHTTNHVLQLSHTNTTPSDADQNRI
jgi:hypothetical protein